MDNHTTSNQTEGTRADQTRGRILQAAIVEFSAHGMAGARTEAIAKSAKVNKALLYYYFKSKENLYSAAVLKVVGEIRESTQAVLDSKSSAGERLLRTALNHFDRLTAHRGQQSLMQQEMVRFHRGESVAIPVLAKTAFAPTLTRLKEVVAEGIQSGELCQLDWFQIWCVAIGSNVFYFLSGPTLRLALPFDPLAPTELEFRRKAILQFLSQALFVDRRRGERLAKRILADTPMPAIKKSSRGRRTQ
jgi:TetR/AcrR family transcriptional regulator